MYTKAHSIKLKYCYTCEIYRPPRSSHCASWDAWIEKIDHHCPWLGTWIGKRNYKYFFVFLNLLGFLIIASILISLAEIYLRVKEHRDEGTKFGKALGESLKTAPYPLIYIVICLFSSLFVIILWGYHHRLLCKSSTTNEDLKGIYDEAFSFNPNK